jgi:hypothetical protein
MFTLAPATRWGYFVYPIGLLGWLVLTRPPSTATADPGQGGIASLGVPAQAGKPGVSASAR